MVGMFLKEPLNLLAVLLQLFFQGFEQLYQCQHQSALGSSHCRTTTELLRFGEDLQSLLVEFWTIKPMNLQEPFPIPAPRLLEQLGGRKSLHKTPARTN